MGKPTLLLVELSVTGMFHGIKTFYAYKYIVHIRTSVCVYSKIVLFVSNTKDIHDKKNLTENLIC